MSPTVKGAESNVFMCKLCFLFKTLGLIRSSCILSYTNHEDPIKIRLFTTTTTFQHIVTILSLRNQPHYNTYSCNSLLPPKLIIFCYFILNSTRNKFHWLVNYSHYPTNSRPVYLHAFHVMHLNQPLKYTTLLHYSVNSHTPRTLTPKYALPQRLVLLKMPLLKSSATVRQS